MHEIKVQSMSPEEAADGVAELWVGGELLAYTHLEDGDLMLRVEPRPDGAAAVIGVRSLTVALQEVDRILAVY